MNWNDVLKKGRAMKGLSCRACRECNGVVCRGEIPGVGGKGTGSVFIRNYEKLMESRITMDLVHDVQQVDTSLTLFNHELDFPVMAAPIGGLIPNYGNFLKDYDYSVAVLQGCRRQGTLGFTGDGANPLMFTEPLRAIEQFGGIATIKPWKGDEVFSRMKLAEKAGACAIAMDIDAAGLPLMTAAGAQVEAKSIEALKSYRQATSLPFIVKGVMTAESALKIAESGASAIVVSNHGGRVLDQTLSTLEVLPAITHALEGRIPVLVDGGFRTGIHVLIALALGASAVLIGRPVALAAHAAGIEGVEIYFQKIKQELAEAMRLNGIATLAEIDASLIAYLPSSH